MRVKTALRHALVCCKLVSAWMLFFFTHNAYAEVNLSFGVYTSDQPTAMVKAYKPILNRIESDLSAALGEPVNISLKVSATYEKGVSNLVDGVTDFSMMGAASYIEAYRKDSNLRILAIDSTNGSKTFNGVICVHADSPITSASELVGKSFAFGNKSSTIGRYLSQAYLHQHGVDAEDLKNYEYLGRHDRVGHAVAAGNFDAGALREGTFNKLVKSGLKLRTLATFPNANRPWIASSKLDEKLFNALQLAMLNIDDEAVFAPFKRKQFVTGDDSDYDVIRDAIDRNHLFFDSLNSPTKIQNAEKP